MEIKSSTLIELIGWLLLGVLIFLGAICCHGCGMSMSSRAPVSVVPTAKTTADLVVSQVKSTDFLNTLFLLALVASIFSALNGLKWGWGGAIASFIGIILKGALANMWIYYILGVLLIAAVVLVGTSLVLKKRVISDLVINAQRLKEAVRGVAILQPMGTKVKLQQELSDAFKDQHPETKAIVQKTKAELKTKGQI